MLYTSHLCQLEIRVDLERYYSVVFSHKNLPVTDLGKLHIADDNQEVRLQSLKARMQMDEVMFLSTCNRVEMHFCTEQFVDDQFILEAFQFLYDDIDTLVIEDLMLKKEFYQAQDAIKHILRVATSIDSMIIGEREIITQVRNAYELSKKNTLTGDFIRLLMRHTIETAKKVYTESTIATKPVSVVSLAYHKLEQLNVPLDAKFLIIGSGVTNTNMCKFLIKHGYSNFTVFNRTRDNAKKLADELKAPYYSLSELDHYTHGFDVILTCTGSESYIISENIYKNLLQGDTAKKTIIDLAIPQDLEESIPSLFPVHYINVDMLQKISNDNLKERNKEIVHVEAMLNDAMDEFDKLYKTRKVEIAMRSVPEKVKEIKQTAVNEVFKKELELLDDDSKELLDKIINYMEKKYISGPMLMAKDILLKQ